MTSRMLYRPVGLKEAQLILDSRCTGFPPRLPDQPIFYPVLNEDYARQIARDWNTPDAGSGYAGFVTAFEVDAAYLSRFETRVVGARMHEELWVPAEQLAEFNSRLTSPVRFTEAHYGPNYRGPETALGALNTQLCELLSRLRAPGAQPREVVRAHGAPILFNAAWWVQAPARAQGLDEAGKSAALEALRTAWAEAFPSWPLPAPGAPRA